MASNAIELGKLHKRQTQCYQSIATEIMYGGAAGGGKSHMIRILAILWALEMPGINIYIFRRISDDLYANHMLGPSGFYELLSNQFENGFSQYNQKKGTIVFDNGSSGFSNGSRIILAHCQYEKDVEKYRGREIHVLMVDELTHFTEYQYRFLRSRCRIPDQFQVPEKYKATCPKCKGAGCQFCKNKGIIKSFPRILSGTNPGGVGHSWVKREFVDSMIPMDNKRMPSEEGGFIRQYIPAKLSDNPSLDEDYADSLAGLGSPDLVRAMKDGDWNIVSGGAFDDIWNPSIHLLNRFKVPASWYIDRSFDWGSTDPFSVIWYAETDGSEVELADGRIFAPPKGSIIAINEYYGADNKGNGLRLSATNIAKDIMTMEASMIKGKWVASEINAGPADNQIANVNESDKKTIKKQMKEVGVEWKRADKSPHSRVHGVQMIRTMLLNAETGEGPGLFFMNNCKNIVKHLPVLSRCKRNPEDVDTKQKIDHDYDSLRYRVLANKSSKVVEKTLYV